VTGTQVRDAQTSGGAPTWISYLLLAGTVLVLGFNWPLLAIGLRDISPLWLVSLRLTTATVIIVTLTLVTGRFQRATRPDAPVVASIAFGRLIAVTVLVFIALTLVPPGRSSVLVWTASLWTVPMAVRFLGEPMTGRRWAGLAVGITGIVLLVEPWGAGLDASTVLGYALLLLAAIANAGTAVHARGHTWTATPFGLLPWQLVLASVPVTLFALLTEGVPQIDWSPGLVGIVLYQGALATGFAMWAQLTVLRNMPAVPTNLSLMMVPVVGLVSSVIVVDEQVTTVAIVGAVLIGAGVFSGSGVDRS
jgi:drug/metabolite transporter (DMT)-like permease